MTILLIGGGSGGHITPLLAVARELKRSRPDCILVGVCEKQSRFVDLFLRDTSIDRTFQIKAGKYRRYAGLSWWQRLFDIKTFLLNVRDAGRTLMGYMEARHLLKQLNPDVILIKGGFVGVPVGLAASRAKIPFITHDSDSVPGLANRIISRWAQAHATGMPVELYDYPLSATFYTGIPLHDAYKKVSPALRVSYRDRLGLGGCSKVIGVVGGSLGADQLNKDMLAIVPELMRRYKRLGIVHITGKPHEKAVADAYKQLLAKEDMARVVVRGFVPDVYAYSGAVDVIISRAGATNTAEFSMQALPMILVPGKLAGGHQDKNAAYYVKHKAALSTPYGATDALLQAICKLLDDTDLRKGIAANAFSLARPDAAIALAGLVVRFGGKKGGTDAVTQEKA